MIACKCMPGTKSGSSANGGHLRAKILCVQPAGRYQPQRRSPPRSKPDGSARQAHQQLKEELGLDHFRRQILDRITPARLDDHDRLRLPPDPPPQGRGRLGTPRGDDIVSGILHVLEDDGATFRSSYAPPTTIYNRTIASLSVYLAAQSDKMAAAGPFPTSYQSTAVTSMPIARRAARKGGEFEEAIGRSRGRGTSKIHALADDRAGRDAFALMPKHHSCEFIAKPGLHFAATI